MLVPQAKPGGVPHRLVEVILEMFEVLAVLGHFGRILRAVLHVYGGSGRALERLLDGLGGMLGGLGQVLGVMSGPKMAAKFGSHRKKYYSKRQKVLQLFFDGFCVEVKQPLIPQNLHLSCGILRPNAYRRFHDTQNFWFLLGANMAPCWLP